MILSIRVAFPILALLSEACRRPEVSQHPCLAHGASTPGTVSHPRRRHIEAAALCRVFVAGLRGWPRSPVAMAVAVGGIPDPDTLDLAT